jgi:hypothetical protein
MSRHSRSVNCFLNREFHDLILFLSFLQENHVLSNYCDSGLVFLSILVRHLDLCSCIVARVLQTYENLAEFDSNCVKTSEILFLLLLCQET